MDRQAKAARAEQILEDPVYKEMVDLIEKGIIKQLEMCPVKDEQYQLKLVTMLQLHKQYQKILNSFIEGGQLADHALKKKSAFNKQGI